MLRGGLCFFASFVHSFVCLLVCFFVVVLVVCGCSSFFGSVTFVVVFGVRSVLLVVA